MFIDNSRRKFQYRTEPAASIAICLLLVSVLICDKIQLINIGGIGVSVHKIFLLFLFIILFFRKIIRKNILHDLDRLQKYTLVFMSVWFIYGSLLYFLNSGRSSAAITEIAYLFFNLLLVTSFFWLLDSKRSLRIFIGTLRAATGILILVGIFEIMSGRHLWMSRFNSPPYADASNPYLSTGFFYNENDYCFFLAVTGLLFCFWKENISKIKRVAYAAAQAGVLFILMIDDSIICILFYTAALVITLLLSRVRLWKTFLAFAGIILMKSFAAVPIRNFLVTMYMRIVNGLHLDVLPSAPGSISQTADDILSAFTNQTGSMFYRLMLILQGASIGISSWFLGVGPAGFSSHVDPSVTGGYVNAHNWYIEIFSQYGIFIFLGYLFIPAALFVLTLHRYKKSKYTENAVLFGMMFSFFTCCIVPSRLIGLNFQWMLFAFFLCANRLMTKEFIQQSPAPN